MGAHRGSRNARRHGQGHRGRHSEAAHRGSRRADAGAHRQRACRPSSASTSTSREGRSRDRGAQGRQLRGARSSRSKSCSACAPSATRRTCLAAKARTRSPKAPRRPDGNLLDLAVEAARAKATVGEISIGAGKGLGRHRAEIRAITGVYKRRRAYVRQSVANVQKLVERFEKPTKAAARAFCRQDRPGRP
jgi:hypothetical protein